MEPAQLGLHLQPIKSVFRLFTMMTDVKLHEGLGPAVAIFRSLVTIRVISRTTDRCPTAERGAISAQSGYDAGESEKVVMEE